LLQIFAHKMTFSRLLVLFFTAILAGLVMLSIIFYRNNQAFDKSAALVTHISTVISYTDSISLLSQNLQWESQNYTLTGDSNAYRTYFSIRDSIQASTNHLIELVWNNKYQHANAFTL